MSDNLYAERDPRELEPHFSRHMMAMTAEDLHRKAAIAEELAYRDKRIEELEAVVEAYNQALHIVSEDNKRLREEVENAYFEAWADAGHADAGDYAEDCEDSRKCWAISDAKKALEDGG